MTIEQLYNIYIQHQSIETDTRKLKVGDLFFALKGENFNGNAFAQQAIDAGAALAIIDEPAFEIAGKTILVPNVLDSLQQMARHHREQFNNLPAGRQVPFIAITGSNGKTTTKELVHAVLSTTFKTYTTEGNLNNHIGIPLTILKIKTDADIAVIEMGANHQKEIESYCIYSQPTHGLITNCGKAHLEGFGSIEGVKKGKGELFDYLRKTNGTAFVMWDYDYLQEMSQQIPEIIKYGTAEAAIEGEIINSEPFLNIAIKKTGDTGNIHTQLVGDYNFPNVLAAVTIGKYFKVPDELIKNAIKNYTPSNSRSQLVTIDSNKIIMDAYNANPSSMKLAIENFSKLPAKNKVLVLGGMAELGPDSVAEHKDLVEIIKQGEWDSVVLVGGDFLKFTHPYITFHNTDEAKNWIREQRFENTYFLVKGSRSMQMEKVIDN